MQIDAVQGMEMTASIFHCKKQSSLLSRNCFLSALTVFTLITNKLNNKMGVYSRCTHVILRPHFNGALSILCVAAHDRVGVGKGRVTLRYQGHDNPCPPSIVNQLHRKREE